MAVKIKLKRLGRTRIPTYRIVVADARTKRDGRAIEEIGKYHPKEEPSFIEVNSERAQHWLSVGAQPTPPVMNILKITGDWQKFKGEPGAEGTLRTREVAPDKKEVFADALKTAAKDSGDSGSTTPRGGGRGRKSDSKASDSKASDSKAKADTGTDTKDAEAKAGSARSESGPGKPKAGSADEAAGAAASSEAPAEEAKAAASSDTPAETATADSSAGSESGSEA